MDTLKQYPQREAQIAIIEHTINTGQSGARRDGMAMAKGEYIIHCDADDWVEKEMYEEMYLKAIETGADSVSCDMVMEFEGSSMYLRYNNTYSDHKLMIGCIAPISVEYCSMCNRLISKRIFDQFSVLPFDGVNMWDDVGLSLRLRYFCRDNAVINKAFYHYNRQNEGSTTHRPLLGRIMEQIECANQLEKFYLKESGKLYRRFVSLVKLVAKDDLFYYNIDEWKKVFPESHKHLYVMKCQVSVKRLVKYYIYAYFGTLAKCIAKMKNRFTV